MQAIDRQNVVVSTPAFVRVMAWFGMLVAAILITIAVAYAAVAVSGALGSRTGSSLAADPLTAPSVVSFRASEHADAATQTGTDPLTAPSLIEFRASEHADAP